MKWEDSDHSQDGNVAKMYDHHIKQRMDQPGKVANPTRGQLKKENEYFPVPVRA